MRDSKLKRKLDAIKADPIGSNEFIICDAKDSDVGFGRIHTGYRTDADGRVSGTLRNRAEFIEQIKAIVDQDLVDLVLMSTSIYEHTALREGMFDGSDVGVAVRSNEATDVWRLRGARYQLNGGPSRPFETADMDFVTSDKAGGREVDLGLYSITFNNDTDADLHTLLCYNDFRKRAAAGGFSHFLEVFNPNIDTGIDADALPRYINDCIIRCLGGVHKEQRPEFLKIEYNGPAATEELAGYDPYGLIVGVLGGSSGTTHDCLKLVRDAQKYGARVALFGRKINFAEDPLGMIQMMRLVADQELDPISAVKEYHAGLAAKGLKPVRALEDDLVITDPKLT